MRHNRPTYPLSKRAALRLLAWYPRPWRERYLVEMRALLEEMPVSWAQTANVAAVAAREWLSPRALGWPARSAAGRIKTARAFMYFGALLALDGLAWALAQTLGGAGITSPPYIWEVPGALLMALPNFILWGRVIPVALYSNPPTRSRHWGRYYTWLHRPLPAWQVVTCAVLLFPSMVEFHANAPEFFVDTFRAGPALHVMWVWIYSRALVRASMVTWRLRRVEKSRLNKFQRLHLDR